jgi:hypothetical protein
VLGPDGRPWHSWRVLLLPYTDANELAEQYRMDEPWDGPNNRLLAHKMPRMYRFHTRTRDDSPITNYLAVVGEKTAWSPSKSIRLTDLSDGQDQTLLLVENLGLNIHWMEPRDIDFDEVHFGSPNGISSPYRAPGAVTVSDSLMTLNPMMSRDVLRALFTRNGGERLENHEGNWQIIEDGRDRPLAK